ncbi:MAG: calcium-binding EGF-like domain-containing protein [Polyangiales bacterium]
MRYVLLFWMVAGCAVDHTGLAPSERPLQPDAAQPDASIPDAARPDAGSDGGPGAGPDAGPPECPVGFERDGDGNCVNIDDCAPNPCLNGGSCDDGTEAFTCTCAPGYAGSVCGTNIDDCAPNPCMNGGVCSDGVASFECSCPVEFRGPTCSIANPEGQLAFYDPLGSQGGLSALPPSASDPRVVASDLQSESYGAASGFGNNNRKPVLMSSGPLDLSTSFYVTVTVTPSAAMDSIALSRVTYFYASYQTGATGTISARTSADGFATTVDSVAWTGASAELVSFDLSSVPVTNGALEVRLYMHDLVSGDGGGPAFTDWADLVSTAMMAGDGMRVFGRIVSE